MIYFGKTAQQGDADVKKTYLYAAIAILVWSSMATVSKLLLGTLNNYQVLCIGAGFAAVAMLITNLVTGKLKQLKTYRVRDLVTMALIGIPGTFLYYIFLYTGTSILYASQALIINYLWPIMSVVFACILLKEKMTLRKAAAFAVSFLGIVVVAGGEVGELSLMKLLGMGSCVCAAVCYGAFTALTQKWNYDTRISMMIAFAASFLLSLVVNLISGVPLELGWLQLLGLGWSGTCTMAVGSVCWALALSSGKTAKVSNLAYITPFLSLVWTSLFLKEPFNPWSVAGLVIIVLGIFIQLKDKK